MCQRSVRIHTNRDMEFKAFNVHCLLQKSPGNPQNQIWNKISFQMLKVTLVKYRIYFNRVPMSCFVCAAMRTKWAVVLIVRVWESWFLKSFKYKLLNSIESGFIWTVFYIPCYSGLIKLTHLVVIRWDGKHDKWFVIIQRTFPRIMQHPLLFCIYSGWEIK